MLKIYYVDSMLNAVDINLNIRRLMLQSYVDMTKYPRFLRRKSDFT